MLKVLAKTKLLKGKTLGVDATTLDANAAMRSIVRRDSGESYDEFLTELAKASGIETPTREDLAKVDKKRPKKGSNKDWEHPHDPDARITRMKDGRTHMAHKVEHAVDMDTQAIVAVTLPSADEGDTESLPWTLLQTELNLAKVSQDPEAKKRLHPNPSSEVVADKGYHGGMAALDEDSPRGDRNGSRKLSETPLRPCREDSAVGQGGIHEASARSCRCRCPPNDELVCRHGLKLEPMVRRFGNTVGALLSHHVFK